MIHRQPSQPSSDWSSSSQSSDATDSARSRRSRRREKLKNRRKASRRLTMEGLESRQLLAANPLGPIPGAEDYDGPRNVGQVSSFKYNEQESAQIRGLNDTYLDAEFVPLGNLSGQRDTIDISGAVSFQQVGGRFVTDIDYYSVDLKAGDILDIATIGAATSFDVSLPSLSDPSQASSNIWFAQDAPPPDQPLPDLYPIDSPLQTLGNAYAAQVVPRDGRYTISVSATTGFTNYTLGLRTYRPVTESLPIGGQQIVFLDFDGGSFARDEFNQNFAEPGLPVGGRFRVPDISQTLTLAGVEVASPAEYTQIARQITQTVENQFADLGNYGANGDYSATGVPGQYGITILNSIDHPDPGNNPLVTRVVFGSVASFPEFVVPPLGIAQSIDVGNFDPSETALIWVDNEVDFVATVPTGASISQADILGLELGSTTSHELAHTFGLYHTDGTNAVPSLIDGGGTLNAQNGLGVGPDGILGTADDVLVRYRTDSVDPAGVITFGTLFSAESMSLTLATGKGNTSDNGGTAGTLTGEVFFDLNGDGSGSGDPGLAGARVYLDVNQNGQLDASEPSGVSDADGTYSIFAAPGTYTAIAMGPAEATSTELVTVGLNGVLTNSGTQQPLVPGSTVFLDYDGDGAQDFNEPSTSVDSDGDYVITGATPGVQTLQIESPSNYAATTPVSQSVTVGTGGGVGPTFGFAQVNPDVTGRKFADLNGDGVLDAGEPGIAGGYIYADLDGDNRPDLGEPFDITDENGYYKLDLPILGRPFAIREVAEPGYEPTVPNNAEHEYIVNFTGAPLGSHFDFGGLPSRDYGDAPDSYMTTVDAGGPSHGVTDGLTLGTQVDREVDGQPNASATGDDLVDPTFDQIDDEDGVVVTSALRVGGTGTIEVTVTNTNSSPGYLQAWIDFNADGDFLDSGEQIRSDAVLGTGTHNIDITLPTSFDINADGTDDGVLDTFSRFRYSHTAGLGVGGPADTGEVEDHAIRILGAGNNGGLATNDIVTVPQNANAFAIDVLRNDANLASNPLTISNVDARSAAGAIVTIRPGDPGEQVVLYSPPSNFTGSDSFEYEVTDSFGNTGTATVQVTVQFATANPIAVDDTFEISSSEKNVPLNVLDNDIASVGGGLTITQVSQGTQGGQLTIDSAGRGVRYTPADGFTGTEQFSYTISDASGQVSEMARVTVVLTPQSFDNDKAEFKIELLDANNDTPLLSLQAGQEFHLRVSVDDISQPDSVAIQGLQSAFTDLLYTSELVTPVASQTGSFPFEITFGPQFETPTFQLGNTLTPGIVDEVGSVQSPSDLATIGSTSDRASFTGFAELFTITMKATGAGLATFKTDPADADVSETTLITDAGPVVLNYDEIKFDSTQIEISPAGDNFPVALDDSFPVGIDSQGQTIAPGSVARLDVLANDLISPGDTVTALTIKQAPGNGSVVRVDVGSDGDLSNDYLAYTPGIGASGFDSFTYILTVESPQFGTVSSVAEVSMTVGAVDDPQVNYDFTFVDEAGNPISSVPVGQRFGLRIDAVDLGSGRPPTEAVFAGFLDVLYNRDFLSTIPVDNGGDPNTFDFDVEFDPQFLLDAAVGINDRAGLIDEFGSNQQDLGGSGTTLATIYFRGQRAGTTTVTGSPADRFPFQSTLIDQNDSPVPIENIQYDSETITITGSPEPLHNASLPTDVNDDNLVTAIDALIVINAMTRLEAAGEQAASDNGSFYPDVNGDGFITAVDALQVINQLNQSTQSANEPVVPQAVDAATPETEEADRFTDQVITELAGEAKDESQADVSGASEVAPSVEVASSDEDDSDDDDLMALLADDVASQWS
ncbi:Ig-like domain-containing protein [Allorhodopirellula solitaria]|uniref:Dockerin type I repeat protein n=1 Tax=Allorhodopirellula solitaria TaxID=2527987 RepID=A0A5C5YJ54_9BACT|nr:Ig-like domain-containing protein [Allorhodopirellula solitaria]TWT74904.1 hypothetical protein CA85_01920 [Allorhodopirellula solitaria]